MKRHPARFLLTAAAALLVIGTASCGYDDPVAPRALQSTVQLEPGETTIAYVSSHCGYEWLLLEVNGQRWTTSTLGADAAGNPTEQAWPNGEATDLELELVDATTLEVTVPGSGVSHTYAPGTDAPGCE